MSYSVHKLSLHQNQITERQVTFHQNTANIANCLCHHTCSFKATKQNQIKSCDKHEHMH